MIGATRTSSGFSLLEVMVGAFLLGGASYFLLTTARTYVFVTARTLAYQNLTLVEKDIEQNLLQLLTTYVTTQTFASPACNYDSGPLSAVFTYPLPSGTQLTLVTNQNVPPTVPQASLYTQALARCQALSYSGSFAALNGIHGCVTATGNWQSQNSGNSIQSQTVLVEFFYSIHDEVTGGSSGTGLVNCTSLVDYPMYLPPANTSSLVAHLIVDAYSINTKISSPSSTTTSGGGARYPPQGSSSSNSSANLASDNENLVSRNTTDALRMPVPYNPSVLSAITGVQLSVPGAHVTFGHQPISTYFNAAYFEDCGGGICSGRQALSLLYFPFASLNAQTVVTAFFIEAGPSFVPGHTAVAQFTNPAVYLTATSQAYNTIGPGNPIVTGIWSTPLGAHAADGLACPSGFSPVLSLMTAQTALLPDCGGGSCSGNQIIW